MGKTQRFIAILYNILENPKHQKIIHWTRDGHAFVIEEKEGFIEEVMQESFATTNFKSFLRQLGWYGFQMRRNEKSEKEYYHKWFTRGNQCSFYRIERKMNHKREKQVDLVELNLSTNNMKQQLNRLRAEQQNLLQQFTIQCKIQSLVVGKVNYIIEYFVKACDEGHLEQYMKPLIQFHQLVAGYIPEVNNHWLETMKECCDPMTPIQDICNTPLFSLFR